MKRFKCPCGRSIPPTVLAQLILGTTIRCSSCKRTHTRESVLDEGTSCPCCNRSIKRYKRAFNSGMAKALRNLWSITKNDTDWHHYTKFDHSRSRETSKMVWWGLVEGKPNDDPKKKGSGYWRITKKGREFATGVIKIESHALEFQGKCEGLTGDLITITDALGVEFDLKEIKSGV